KIEFFRDKMWLKKNRQYKEHVPLEFELNKEGSDNLVLFLKEDLEKWYSEKMKMFYNDKNRLIVMPDKS
ncbi:MAG: hypothetical protein AAGF87_10895, partial [Bacteroidota bacterium]